MNVTVNEAAMLVAQARENIHTYLSSHHESTSFLVEANELLQKALDALSKEI